MMVWTGKVDIQCWERVFKTIMEAAGLAVDLPLIKYAYLRINEEAPCERTLGAEKHELTCPDLHGISESSSGGR